MKKPMPVAASVVCLILLGGGAAAASEEISVVVSSKTTCTDGTRRATAMSHDAVEWSQTADCYTARLKSWENMPAKKNLALRGCGKGKQIKLTGSYSVMSLRITNVMTASVAGGRFIKGVLVIPIGKCTMSQAIRRK